MELIKEIDWFLRPTDFHLTIKDSFPQPSVNTTKEYLSAIEQVLIKTGVQFREEPPIEASVYGPLSEFIDLKISLSYTNYLQEKTPLDSLLIVSNHDLSAVNQLCVVLFPDNGLPWADGTEKVPEDKYVRDYTPVNHYLRLITRLMDEMSDKGLLVPGPSTLSRIFRAPA